MKVFFNWFWFLLIVGGIASLVFIQWRRPLLSDHLATLPKMTGGQVILFALAFAFAFTELGIARHKPLNCLKCMCGWTALILAFTFHVQFWYMYLPVGLLVGAVFSAIKMRWL